MYNDALQWPSKEGQAGQVGLAGQATTASAFIVMELVEGPTLEDMIAGSRLSALGSGKSQESTAQSRHGIPFDHHDARHIYVQPFPGTAAKFRVSTSGGAQVRWRGDGLGMPVPLFATRIGNAVQSNNRQMTL